MKIKNLFAIAALLISSASAYAAHVISPNPIVGADGIYYEVQTVFKAENPGAGEINTVWVAISNNFANATLNIPDEVTLTLNAGSKDENSVPVEGPMTFKVTGIMKDAFRNNRQITTVNVGKNVEFIDNNAFNNCTKISAVNFAEGSALAFLGHYCFGNTPSLKSLNFDKCEKLTDLNNASWTPYPWPTYPFYTSSAEPNNNYLTTLTMNKVEKIGTVLSNLTALSTVTFSSLTQLDSWAFQKDASLISLSLPATCATIASSALENSSVATLVINSKSNTPQTINANVYGTASLDVLTSLEFKGVSKPTIIANAFNGNKLTSVKFAEVAGGTINAAAIKLAPDAASTIAITKISSTAFAAGAFVGPTAPNKVALGIGDVAVAISNKLVSANVGAATTGTITATLDLDVLGDASSISFGTIATGGSIKATSATTDLTSVTFTSTVVAGGVTAGAFTKASKLATVEFQGLLAKGAVATGAFGDATSEAGQANTVTPANPWYIAVTYRPTVYTQAFDFDAFKNVSVSTNRVKFITNRIFAGDSQFDSYYGVFGFFNVQIAYDGLKFPIEVAAPEGETTLYGKFIADGTNFKIAKTNSNGAKVVVYEAYIDENNDSKLSNIVMLPLTLEGNYYIVKRAEAVVVRAWGEGDIIAEATTDNDTHNYDGFSSKKNEIRYYDQYNSFNYTTASIDGSLVLNQAKVAGYNYVYAMKNPATSTLAWGRFTEDALLPPYTIYIYTHFLGSQASGARLGVIWADGEDEATGIQKVAAVESEDGAIYNLAGQKVSASYKGVVIKNGKKYINK